MRLKNATFFLCYVKSAIFTEHSDSNDFFQFKASDYCAKFQMSPFLITIFQSLDILIKTSQISDG